MLAKDTMNNNTKAVLQKTVDTANANALKAYESSVNVQLESIKNSRASIKDRTASYESDVAYHATAIAAAKTKLDALTPPKELTAADIFGADIVDAS